MLNGTHTQHYRVEYGSQHSALQEIVRHLTLRTPSSSAHSTLRTPFCSETRSPRDFKCITLKWNLECSVSHYGMKCVVLSAALQDGVRSVECALQDGVSSAVLFPVVRSVECRTLLWVWVHLIYGQSFDIIITFEQCYLFFKHYVPCTELEHWNTLLVTDVQNIWYL